MNFEISFKIIFKQFGHLKKIFDFGLITVFRPRYPLTFNFLLQYSTVELEYHMNLLGGQAK